MSQKGIAPLIIAIIVVVAVVCAGVGVYIVIRGSGGLADIPVYSGAVENAEGTAFLKASLENMGASAIEVSAYTSTQDVSTIELWYSFKMIELGWTKENEGTTGISDSPILTFKRGNDGAIVGLESYQGKTNIMIFYGQFGSIQQLWGLFYAAGLYTTRPELQQ